MKFLRTFFLVCTLVTCLAIDDGSEAILVTDDVPSIRGDSPLPEAQEESPTGETPQPGTLSPVSSSPSSSSPVSSSSTSSSQMSSSPDSSPSSPLSLVLTSPPPSPRSLSPPPVNNSERFPRSFPRAASLPASAIAEELKAFPGLKLTSSLSGISFYSPLASPSSRSRASPPYLSPSPSPPRRRRGLSPSRGLQIRSRPSPSPSSSRRGSFFSALERGQSFLSFTEMEFSEENVLFVVDCKELLEVLTIDRTEGLQELVDTYITSTAPKQVNLPGPQKKELLELYESFQETPSVEVIQNLHNAIAGAQETIEELMERDTYPRFMTYKKSQVRDLVMSTFWHLRKSDVQNKDGALNVMLPAFRKAWKRSNKDFKSLLLKGFRLRLFSEPKRHKTSLLSYTLKIQIIDDELKQGLEKVMASWD